MDQVKEDKNPSAEGSESPRPALAQGNSPHRNLGDVVDAMLLHVPSDHRLHARLEKFRRDIRYTAPECEGWDWDKGASILYNEMGPESELTKDWERTVAAIWVNQSWQES